MNIIRSKGCVRALVLVAIGIGLSGCNTSKATVDTFAKFTSSTSPGEWITTSSFSTFRL